MSLRETMEAATPGPWESQYHVTNSADVIAGNDPSDDDGWVAWDIRPANAALIALAPELAALVLDMGEALAVLHYWPASRPDAERVEDLLARLNRIGKERT